MQTLNKVTRCSWRRNSAPATRRITTSGGTIRSSAARLPNPEQVFRLRCWARATLYAAFELELIEAVDALQAAAVATGLVGLIGQDEVQAIMSSAFGGGGDDELA